MKYGCHNRAPYKEPHRMSPNCEYTKTDLGKADARCVGCKWREQNELAIPTTSTSAVDSKANQRIRATTTRTSTGCTIMSKQIDALKLALEALEQSQQIIDEYMTECVTARQANNEAITTIKEALAQPEQEPVAVVEEVSHDGYLFKQVVWKVQPHSFDYGTKFYTTTPKRKPLTDEQIFAVARDHYNPHQRAEISFARAIEAAHGIKGEA